MEKFYSRPLLKAGLILGIVGFSLMAAGSAYLAFVLGVLGELAVDLGAEIMETISIGLMVFISILLLAFCVASIVVCSMALARCKLNPDEFDKKKGMITASFVMCVIMSALMLASIISSFSVGTILFLALFVLSAVLIMIDRVKNKELLAKYKAEELANAQNAEVAEIVEDK